MPPLSLQPIPCPLCGADHYRILGIRGNREYNGADPKTTPHVFTNVARCLSCDFIYANPMVIGAEALESAYYDDPQRYQATSGIDTHGMFARRLEVIERHAPRGSLLDIGAGKGEFLAVANQRGWKASGIEPSIRFCEHARRVLGVDIQNSSFDAFHPTAVGSFDAACMNHVLEHVPDPKRFLLRARSMLKPSGLLFIEVPNSDSHLLRAADLYFRAKGLNWSTRLSPLHPPFHRFGFTQKSLRFALHASGFELVSLDTLSGEDRGTRDVTRDTAVRLRDLAMRIFSNLGNRELLVALARPKP